MNREPVLIVMSALTVLQLVAGSAALSDLVGLQATGLAIVVIGALQAGVQFYVRGQVTPNADVAVVEPEPGVFIAGEAGPVRKGRAVDVTAAGPSPYTGDRRPGGPVSGPGGTHGELGQITGTLVLVIVLISAAVAVLVVALLGAL